MLGNISELFKRRILIGALIGVFVTAILSWVDKSSWKALEVQFIDGRAFFNVFSPYNKFKKDILVFKLDKDTELYLKKNNLVEINENDKANFNSNLAQVMFLEIVKDLDAAKAKAIGFLVKVDKYVIQELEIESNIEGVVTPLIFVHDKNVTRTKEFNGRTYQIKPRQGFAYELFTNISNDDLKDADKKRVWLNTSRPAYQEASLVDFIEGKFDFDNIRDKIVFIVDDSSEQIFKTEILILSNYLNNHWLYFLKIPSLLFLILMMALGVLMLLSKPWARLVSLTVLMALYFIIGQILFMICGINIETAAVLVGALFIFLLSYLVDSNLVTFALNEKLRFAIDPKASSRLNSKEVETQNLLQSLYANYSRPKFDETQLKDLNYYVELEENLETYALELQEKTIKSIMEIQSKIDHMILSELYDKDTMNELHLINYDFNKTMDDLDNILFDMVPFQLEKDHGLLDPIRHLADKVLYKSKGAMRASLSCDLENLDIDRDVKVNIYRIIQKLIDIVIERSRGTNIHIDINLRNHLLKFYITYDGINVNPQSENKPYRDYRFRDVFRRLELINGELSFKNDLAMQSELTNKIRLEVDLKGLLKTETGLTTSSKNN